MKSRLNCEVNKVNSKFLSLWEGHFLETTYRNYILHNARTQQVLNFDTENLDESTKRLLAGATGARDLPSSEQFRGTAWPKIMLLRYSLAMHYSKGKNVLETCSGLGWGAFLLASVTRNLTCIEKDIQSVNLSRRLWQTNGTNYLNASVLQIPIKDDQCDVVVAMECIEHFSFPDIRKYVGEVYRVLKPEGILIGSSYFPETREDADALCSTNEFHLHICTKQEINQLLSAIGFKRVRVFSNRLFITARKPSSA